MSTSRSWLNAMVSKIKAKKRRTAGIKKGERTFYLCWRSENTRVNWWVKSEIIKPFPLLKGVLYELRASAATGAAVLL